MKHSIIQEIALTTPQMLLSEHYYRRLWLAVRNVDIPRRDWLDELADTFRDYDGRVITAWGTPYELPFVDDVFGDDEDMRWLGYYMTPDVSGLCPLMRCRKIERLQLLDLYFRLKWPEIAKNFKN